MEIFGWDPFSFLKDFISLIPKLLYLLTASVMALMDLAQLILRKFAGLDTYYIGDGEIAQTGDIVLAFLQGIFNKNSSFPALKNAFIAILILGVIMLVVTTIIAVIRQEYMPGAEELKEKPTNSKYYVIARSVKSLFLFLIVPVSVVFGLMFSDILLKALDSVTTGGNASSVLILESGAQSQLVAETTNTGDTTYVYYDLFIGGSPTTSVPFSGMVFKSSAYLANRVRINKTYAIDEATTMTYYQALKSADGQLSNFGIFNLADSPAEAAQMIDDAFASNVHLKTPGYLITDTVPGSDVDSPIVFSSGEITNFSKFNVSLVWYYYDLWQFNFLIAFAFLVICLKLFVKIVTGLMKRIIEMVALFLISPPVIAIMPLDNGRGFGEWKKNFMSKALMAYGAIIGMNLFFLVLPYINDIRFFGASTFDFTHGSNVADMINLILSTLFIVTGLVVVESFIELTSTMIGSESAAKVGGELVGKVGDTIAASAKYTGAAAGFAVRAATAPLTVPAAVIGKTTGLDKKIKQKLQFSKEGKKNFTKEHKKKWQDKEAAGAYDNYLKDNNDFNKGMTDLFNQRDDKTKTFDQWSSSKEGKVAKDLVTDDLVSSGKVDSFSTFKKGESGEGGKAFSASLKQAMDGATSSWGGALSSRASIIGSAVSSFASQTIGPMPILGKLTTGKIANSVGKMIKNTYNESLQLAKHANAFASNFPLLLSSAFERNNKAGMKSMMMAFQGKSASAIELEEIYERIKDEESQKVAVQQDKLGKDSKQTSAAVEDNNKDIKDLTQRLEKLEREAKIGSKKSSSKEGK